MFRLGLLAIDTRSGVVPELDLLAMAIRGLVQMGCVPANVSDISIDVTPIDFAASAIVHLALSPASGELPSTFHLANPPGVSLRQLMRCLKGLRPDLKEVTRACFLDRIDQNPNA